MLIYKILRADEWRALREAGATTGAPIDVLDGFVHFSTAEQVRGTARRHFEGLPDLVLLAVETKFLANLRWEPSRGGDLFPHLYDTLKMADVVWHRPLPLTGGGHEFPEEVA